MRRGPPNYDEDRRRRYLLAALIPLLLLLLLFWVQWFTSGDDSEPEAVQPLPEQLLVSAPAQDGDATVRVPDVRGQPRDDAEDILGDIGLVPDVKGVPTANPDLDGIVIVTDPPGGDGVPPGTTVVVTVGEFTPPTATVLGDTTVRVPDVVGEEVDDAEEILTDADLVPQGRPVPTADPDLDGIVIDTNPDGGTVVPEGSTITFTFGDYQPTTATVRTGDPPDGTATTQPPDGNNPGGNNPGGNPTPTTQPPGNQPPGDVPDGKVKVPNLIGMPKADAEQTLINLRLLPEADGRLLAVEVLHGVVDTQDTPADTLVDPGTTIAFTYGIWEGSRPTGPDTVAVPDLDGMTQAEAEKAVLDVGLLPQGTGHHVTIAALDDRVTSQDPDAGTQVARDSTVAFTYGIHTDNPPPPTTQPPGNNPPGNNPPGNNPPGDTPPGDDLVAVPNLIGMTKADAEQTVLAVGLLPEALGRLLEAQSLDGIVDTQEDPPGTLLPRGTTLAFTYGVHKGSRPTGPDTVAVPDLVGLTQAAAEQAVLDAGLLPQATGHAVTDQAQHDKVDTQNPAAGTQVARDSTVDFTYGIHTPVVGGGPNGGDNGDGGGGGGGNQPPTGTTTTTTTTTVPKVTVPDLIGSAKATADAAVLAVGLVPSGTAVAVTDPAQDGKVQTQNPAAGTQVNSGTTVAFTYGAYSAPPPNSVTVPDLIGSAKATAEAAVTAVGLVPSGSAVTVTDPAQDGKVQTQNPAAGTQVSGGSTVAFTYGEYTAPTPPPAQVTVPDIVGSVKATGEGALTAVGLVPSGTAVAVADPAQDGLVQTQNPAAGTQVASGSTVTFTYGEYTAPTPPPTTQPPDTDPPPPRPPAIPVTVEENALVDVAQYSVSFTDSGGGKPEVTYSLSGSDADDFDILNFEGLEGLVNNKRHFDFEDPDDKRLSFTAEATAAGVTVYQDFVVTVTDVNDRPEFSLGEFECLLRESSAAGTSCNLPGVVAADDDGDALTFSLSDAAPRSRYFAIDPATGQVTLTDAAVGWLDAETLPEFSVSIQVSDGKDADGNPDDEIDDQAAIRVSVRDVADETPWLTFLFSNDRTSWMSAVWSTDRPKALQYGVQYRAVGDADWIDHDLMTAPGVLQQDYIDRFYTDITGLYADTEYELQYCIGAVACGSDTYQPGANTLRTEARSNAPARIGGTSRLTIAENVDPTDTTSNEVGRIYAHSGNYDPERDTLSFWLEGPGAGNFAVAPAVSTEGVITTTAALDYETQASYDLTLHVSDGRGPTGAEDPSSDDSADITIIVTDVLERPAAPTLTASATTAESVTLTWPVPDAGDQTISGYQIQYKPASDTQWGYTDHLTGTQVTIDHLTPDTAYDFRGLTLSAASAYAGSDLDTAPILTVRTDTATTPTPPPATTVAPAQVAVPDLLGLTKAAAEQALSDAGLIADARAGNIPEDPALAGEVYQHQPGSGTLVNTGSTVIFFYYAQSSVTPPPVTTTEAPDKVDVPKVSGAWNDPAAFDLDAAKKKITDAGLVWEIVDFPRNDRPDLDGWIGAQSPPATSDSGEQADRGSTVTMTVHRYVAPMVTVPDLVGETKADAEQALTDAGLVPDGREVVTFTPSQVGEVLWSKPAAGTQVDPGATVQFGYGVAPPKVTVPDVVGETKADAEKAITDAGLAVQTTGATATDDSAKVGTVAHQNPTAGAQVDSGSTVTLSYYALRVTIPNVVGMQKDAAEQELRDAGLVPVAQAILSTAGPDGQVQSQQPNAGTTTATGATVTFLYYKH